MRKAACGSLATLVLLLAPARAGAQWEAEVPMTSTGSDVWGEGIASAGDTLHVVHGTAQVVYRKSTDQGATWTPPQTIDDGTLHLTDPIVADGADVWVVVLKDLQNKTDWCCSRDLGNIYLLHSGDSGASWDPPKKLTSAQGAFRVSIAYAAGRLHLVWMDYRSNAWDTYYLRSVDRGATWDPEKVIATSTGTFGAERPQVAARGDSVHVTIWDDRGSNPTCMAGPSFTFTPCPDTFHIRSTNGGTTWGTEVNVAASGAAFSGRNDVAVAGAQSVVINFNRAAPGTADANPHLYVVRSPDDGATWNTPLQLTNTPGSSDHGSIIGAGPVVHLAWHDSRGGKLAIYYIASVDEGVSWLPEEKVSTPTATESSTPLLAVTSGWVHALWLDQRSGTYQIYYRRRAAPMAATPDAGVSDASVGDGALADAAQPTVGDLGASDERGCDCRLGGDRPRRVPIAGLLALAWVVARRRRARDQYGT